MSKLRFRVVESAFKKRAAEVPAPAERPSDYFGQNVFNRAKMFKYLPEKAYERITDCIDNGAPLDRETADAVAAGMKKWAIEMGATHYTHWFHPLTEGTAEKHDAFVEHDGKGGMVEEFSGKLLVQQEPDASSFPNGGIRNTFEARGYSAWDPSSPAFIVGDTLCIPTIFIAYTGESLDYKVPLLKSLEAVNKAATEVCHYFNPDVKKVYSYLGWEQEYFLVDEGLYAARPDLLLTGRTLMGHESSKNQQLEDHYFGAIPTRVMEFMKDLEIEALKLGIPLKTRHNEVAPNQFELAPIYEECNLANDHNLLVMALMRKISRKHGFRVLLHEKPFKGVNGSGKHNNWSLGTDTGILLMAPGKTPEDNLRFITFIVNVLMAVYRHNGLLKASISSATNAHRLGANEAPPAIISSFLGAQISEVLEHLEKSEPENLMLAGKQGLKLDVARIPELFIDNTDRNRTSPFAFTGNRFEFRAVGSEANCASAMLVLNAAVAEQLKIFKAEVDAKIADGKETFAAILEVIRKDIKTCKAIHFDGNGYSDEWKAEAARRGLDCETSVPVIFDNYLKESSIKMFESTGVMTRKELEARNEVKWETYTKKIQIEARVLGDIAMNHIIPTATTYQTSLIDNVYKMKDLFPADKAAVLSSRNLEIIEDIAHRTNFIKEKVDEMIEARKVANKIENEREKAIAYHDNIVPMLEAIRYHIDKLELVVDDQIWTLPKYRELLFIR
ncbi:glutamine synthetase type III [Parabacteroides sp. AF48-14]|uniref:glutamine synthetase III family protein n=1 Tax=Parabacteroides sp. AF48-14 TaxID=2292052 RepID=UPI000EFDD147|nr:glutamine synthetase III [Parabacteroides sp. AF48-14]RHO73026.1 glutamine synthetase type III [Parabacteroides sp. AF48-14]